MSDTDPAAAGDAPPQPVQPLSYFREQSDDGFAVAQVVLKAVCWMSAGIGIAMLLQSILRWSVIWERLLFPGGARGAYWSGGSGSLLLSWQEVLSLAVGLLFVVAGIVALRSRTKGRGWLIAAAIGLLLARVLYFVGWAFLYRRSNFSSANMSPLLSFLWQWTYLGINALQGLLLPILLLVLLLHPAVRQGFKKRA